MNDDLAVFANENFLPIALLFKRKTPCASPSFSRDKKNGCMPYRLVLN